MASRLLKIFSITLLFTAGGFVNAQPSASALLVIDIQKFYFEGGKWELENPLPAARNASKLINFFRQNQGTVVHVRHNSKPGMEIHPLVAPAAGEKVITKDAVNCFKDTDLLKFLQTHQIKKLVICGMMTHMCVEAATRAAADLGFEVTLIHDACATRSLKFGEKVVPASEVQNTVLATLNGSYAKVVSTDIFMNQ